MRALTTKDLTIQFGGLAAVSELNLSVPAGEIFSIIGPNGAGKTTVFNAITGLNEPTRGEIYFKDSDLRRPFTDKTLAVIIATALVTGLASMAIIFLESLWQAGIIDNYSDPDVFSWFQALEAMAAVLRKSPYLAAGSLMAGCALGGTGSLVVWRRTRRAPDLISRRGVSRTFQNIHLFSDMTVRENVVVVRETQSRSGLWGMTLRTPSARREEAVAEREAQELLDFVGLGHRARMLAKNLPYGEQRRLEIARALARDPELLLLDEPAAGMNPSESRDLMALIQKIRARGITVLLIEHHMKVVMGISDTIAVLDHGVKIAEGPPSKIQNDPQVLEAYLGREEME